MLGLALAEAGLDPTVIVGSKVREFGGRNLRVGRSDLLVAEACEYRRSFLNLTPTGVVLLNCEAEHLDYYRDEADYVESFCELVRRIPSDGFLVANMSDNNVSKVAHHCAGEVIAVYGDEAKSLGVELGVPGDFNRLNALMALRAAERLGADSEAARRALGAYRGVWRRMEERGGFRGARVIDDYGHHPTEVRLTLQALKEKYQPARLICVFQPHQFSRTHRLLEDFKHAFASADKVIVPDIYEARDTAEDKATISAEAFVKALSGEHMDVVWGRGKAGTVQLLNKLVHKNDLIVVMGAGDVTRIADELVDGG
jgi:UDP-N-acetylmuramate--alanine ligase